MKLCVPLIYHIIQAHQVVCQRIATYLIGIKIIAAYIILANADLNADFLCLKSLLF